MPMHNRGLNHLAMITNDMDKTVKFWTEVMRCPITTTLHLPPVDPYAGLTWSDLADKKHYFFDIGNGSRIAFFDLGDLAPETKESGTNHHVALGVADEDELLENKAHLEAHGVEVSEVVDHFFCRSIYFKDPNGIYMEYAFYTGEWTAEKPFIQDANPVPSAAEHLGTKQDEFLIKGVAGHAETYETSSPGE